MAQSTLVPSEDSFDSMTDCHPLYHSTGVYDVNPSIDDFLGQADNYTTPTTNTNTSTTEQPPPPPSSPAATKRLACERCHNQKLRCARQQGKHSCDRCLAANAPCAERIPRRLGRPHSTNASVSKTAAAKKRRQRSDAAKSSGHHRNNSKATNSNNNSNVSVSSDQSQSNQVDDLKSMNCAAGGAVQQVQSVSVNRTPPSSIPDESRPTPWPLTGLLSPSDCSSPFDWNLGGNEADASADTAATLGEDAYQGHSVFDAPLMAGLGGLDSLITDLDEMPDTLLTTHMDMEHHLVAAAAATATAADANMTSHTTANTTTASSFSPPTTTISMTTSSSMAQVQQDPVERLTSLHLELYQCLNSFRSLEQQCQPEPDSFGAAVALEWVERLFQSTEEFIDILRQGFGPGRASSKVNSRNHQQQHENQTISSNNGASMGLACLGSPAGCSPASSCFSSSCLSSGCSSSASPSSSSSSPASPPGVGIHHHHQGSPASSPSTSSSSTCAPVLHPLDSATSLMVVSCYVRLLQIFDSFAAVLPSTLDAGFTANNRLLGVRIGSFCPAVLDKRLASALVAQYVCSLLESIRAAVEAALLVDGGSDSSVMVPMHAAVHGPTLVEARASEAALRERIAASMNLLVPGPRIVQ